MRMKGAELIRKFVDEVLSGDWKKFETFDVRTLQTSELYGCPGRNFDCDDTELMRAAYVVLWGDFFPDLTMENYGYRKQYRGIPSIHSTPCSDGLFLKGPVSLIGAIPYK